MNWSKTILLIVILTGCQGPEPCPGTVDEEEFLTHFNALYDDYANSDLKWLEHYHPDLISINREGEVKHGAYRLRPSWEETYEKYDVVLVDRTDPTLITSSRQVVAFNDYFEYFIDKGTRDTFPVKGTYISVWSKGDDGSWKIKMDTYHEKKSDE